MKKVMLLGISILGMNHFANAWTKQMPQTIIAGANGHAIVTCFNTQNGWCMTGEGSSPSMGQKCIIWGPEFKKLGVGTIIRCSLAPNEQDPTDENEPVEAEFILE
ncbi:hypothetical protein D9M68_696170 [compost metagenome]